ncbi:hypothetical protein CCHR01_15485 [Colletotrichum chrysophilum]|uniref:Uncharacterized protein n=1 Tax=Colletotrichum chrysophilum TaxID=1836956 RepID=A0AAD9A5P6_9PEZI|nr:hypothetical protein CCHR01_15485 [Colletotrichum chrysophilum]
MITILARYYEDHNCLGPSGVCACWLCNYCACCLYLSLSRLSRHMPVGLSWLFCGNEAVACQSRCIEVPKHIQWQDS